MLPAGGEQVPAAPLGRLFLFNSPWGLFIADESTLALGTRRASMSQHTKRAAILNARARCSILRPSIGAARTLAQCAEWWRSRLKAHYDRSLLPKIWSSCILWQAHANYCARRMKSVVGVGGDEAKFPASSINNLFVVLCLHIRASFVIWNIWRGRRGDNDVTGNTESSP